MQEYAPGAAFARSREAFAQIEEWLGGPAAGGLGHAALEVELAARGREIQRLLLQEHLDLRAAREQRLREVAGPDGIARRRAERGHARPLASVFGPVTVTRIAYRAAGAPNVHPADAGLGLPPGKHSHGLSRMVAVHAPRGSFEQARAEVTRATGCKLGKRQCEQLARAAAADFESFYAARRAPAAAPGAVLALSCDGKGIAVRPGHMRPESARKAGKSPGHKQDGRLSRGEVRTRKRMAEVGAVFDITPVPRTLGDILGPDPRPDGPQAAGKWVTASVAAPAAAVVASVFDQAARRDPDCQRTWIALADGNLHQLRRIRAEAAGRGIPVTVVIDFIHVTEHLWDAAWSFFDEASPGAGPWVRARAAEILDGRAAGVAAALRHAAAGLSKAKRKAADKTAAYLDAKAPFLDYPTALAAGWPISSGVIEGACRYLVKDRMAITGARWGTPTAEAILKLRALHANDDFDDYWAWHLQCEHQRNYGARAYALAA